MTAPSARHKQRSSEKIGTLKAIKPLLTGMSARRWMQFRLTILLMIVGGIAEMVSLGAVLAFLALLSGSTSGGRFEIAPIFEWFGMTRGDDLIVPAIALLIVTGLVATIIRLVLAWVSHKFVLRVGHDIGVQIYSKMLRQPYSFHVQRNTSEFISGIEKVQTIIFAVLLPVMQGVVATVVAAFIIIALITINPAAAILAAVAIAIPYMAVSFATRRVLRINSETAAIKQTERIKQVQEGLGGMRDILIDQSQAVFEEGFRKLDDSYRRAQTVNAFVAAAPRYIVEFAGIVLIAVLALFMSGQPGGMVAAIPVLGAMALGAQRLLPLMQQMYFGWSYLIGSERLILDVIQLSQASISTRRLRDKNAPVAPFKRDLVLDSVEFRYPETEQPAVRIDDLRIIRGERVGLVGETGSGKSTLLDLMMGLLEPTRGELRVDGAPLGDANVAEWQAQIAHVPQAIYLSDSSIASNIAFGEEADAIDMARVRNAAERAQIANFLESLPEGYLTRVGERGVRLSGGQRQRIGIARALYKRANVLILDEATSALDDRTEAAVMEALSRSDRQLTLLIIAHRLTTLACCDRIIRMADGKIVEQGSYAAVIDGRDRSVLALGGRPRV